MRSCILDGYLNIKLRRDQLSISAFLSYFSFPAPFLMPRHPNCTHLLTFTKLLNMHFTLLHSDVAFNMTFNDALSEVNWGRLLATPTGFIDAFWCIFEWGSWLSYELWFSSNGSMNMLIVTWLVNLSILGIANLVHVHELFLTTDVPSRLYWFINSLRHICVSKLSWDNGLSCGRRQAIITTNDGILLIWRLGTQFSEPLNEIHIF